MQNGICHKPEMSEIKRHSAFGIASSSKQDV